MRELPKRHRPLLEVRRIVVASVDRVLMSSDQLERGHGPSLVAAAKARQPSLRCLMLIQRPLLRTIQAQAKEEGEGLCSHERIGNGGLLSKRVSDTDRDEVETAPGHDVLMRNYIDEQGGCQDLVRKLR